MPRRLFTVTDVYLIRGRGLVVLPGIVPIGEERFRIGELLLLKRPDGSEIEATIGGLEMFTDTTRPDIPVMLRGLGKEDVPIGTEVWSLDRAAG